MEYYTYAYLREDKTPWYIDYVVVGELSVFANENNLLPNGISRLINGKRKTYRGWKLVK